MADLIKLFEEFSNYTRTDLIEEIARLRLVVLSGNCKAYQKAKDNFNEDVKLAVQELKEHKGIDEVIIKKFGNYYILFDSDFKEIFGEGLI